MTKAMITSVRDKKWQMVPPEAAREKMEMVPHGGASDRKAKWYYPVVPKKRRSGYLRW